MNYSKQYKILIVDDDPGILKMLTNILIQNDVYEVLTTGNGKSACTIASMELPDIIIMDWEMPIMNGVDAIKEMKGNPYTDSIPVIILTGVMIDTVSMNQAFVSGAVDYLRKPFDEVELKARIANMIRISDLSSMIKQQNLELQNQLTTEILKTQQLDELKKWTLKQLTLLKEKAIAFDDKEVKNVIIQTERLLNSKVTQTNWVDFESHFNAINPRFFEKALACNRTFTINELRLCAFLKLNMSNKEIAQILYTSADSVNTARKRLKKKLGLLPEDNLLLFIRNL
jgi:DNA-binding response OmpR family regulator